MFKYEISKLHELGLKVNWGTVYEGWARDKCSEITPLSDEDIIAYAVDLLDENSDEKVMALAIEKPGYYFSIAKVIKNLSDSEKYDPEFEIRKWRLAHWHSIKSMNITDYIDRYIELFDFWMAYDLSDSYVIDKAYHVASKEEGEPISDNLSAYLVDILNQWAIDELEMLLNYDKGIL